MLPNRHKDRTDPCYSRGQRIGVIHLAHWSMSTLTSNNLKIYPLPSTLMAQLIARLTSTLWNRVQISQWLFNYFGLPNNSYMYTFRNIFRFETQPFWRITCNYFLNTFRTTLRFETRPFWRVQISCFLPTVSSQNTLWNPHVLQPNRYEADRCETQPFWTQPFCTKP
jgi:hypothetical protein